ncbi:hypothetical protein PINS_up006221 [Pythium insidiosum]|nr:hypothetical protein PINS_up006221 [Pythium insidiosum]
MEEQCDVLAVNQLCHRSLWVRDKERSNCSVCTLAFTRFRRRHHCRLCGDVACRDCIMRVDADVRGIGRKRVKACLVCIGTPQRFHHRGVSTIDHHANRDRHQDHDRDLNWASFFSSRSRRGSSAATMSSVDSATTDSSTRGECMMCVSAHRNAVCVPCGHVAGCKACLSRHVRQHRVCPICRADVETVIRIYEC